MKIITQLRIKKIIIIGKFSKNQVPITTFEWKGYDVCTKIVCHSLYSSYTTKIYYINYNIRQLLIFLNPTI